MKKLLHYVWPLLLFSPVATAQFQNDLWVGEEANNWFFGVKCGLTFNSSPPTVLADSQIVPESLSPSNKGTIIEGSGSISDAQGNVLFYTNGVRVWNRNNEIMPNGDGLLGDPSSVQNGLIVPVPGNPNKYYIFSVSAYEGTYFLGPASHVVYSEVDMGLNGGLGDITTNKNIEIATEVEEKISAIYHADGEKIWVAVLGRSNNEYKVFLISRDGLNPVPVVSNIGNSLASDIGQMKFSPDGTKLATSRMYYDGHELQVFNFDNETGRITNIIATINGSDLQGEGVGCYGVEFSPDSKLLYGSAVLTGSVFQFNLEAGSERDIKASGIIVGQPAEFSSFSMQLGPDGKIYLANGVFMPQSLPYTGSDNSLNVINYPNNVGLACGYVAEGINLQNGFNDQGLPGFIQSYFESGILHQGECANEAVTFSTIRIPGIENINWNFGDTASGANNISTDLTPSHIFSTPGNYTVTATAITNGVPQTATTQVIITAPDAVVPQVPAMCADANGNAVFNLNQFNNTVLAGQDADAFTVAYYSSEADLQSNTPIANAANFTTVGQAVYAQVVNNTTGCYTNISFALVVNPIPIAAAPGTVEVCANTTGEAVFNLTQQNAVILGNQDPTLFTVAFYADEQDVQNNNPIATPDVFSSTGQIIYAVVKNNTTGCTANIQFEISAIQPPSIAEAIEYTGCSPFNLTAIAAQQSEGFTLTFYANENDAVAGTNPIADTERYIDSDNEATLYIIAKNAQGCEDKGTLNINAGNCSIPRGISPNNDGFNDRFDLSGFNIAYLGIYNRFGQEVYSRSNYTSEWHGQSTNNNELPTGTYYYMVKRGDGRSETGWVYVNREE